MYSSYMGVVGQLPRRRWSTSVRVRTGPDRKSLEVFDEDPPRLSNGCWSSSVVQTSGGSGELGTCNHVSPNINATASTALDVHLCQGVALASNDRAMARGMRGWNRKRAFKFCFCCPVSRG